MTDTMRNKFSVVFGGGILVLCFLLVYNMNGLFHMSRNRWRMFPRDWVTVDKGHQTHTNFKYLTYNVLQDAYMKVYKDEYRFCDNVLDFKNLTLRQAHMMTEVETINPDTACFQEVDEKWYETFWYPQMAALGYDGMLGVDQSSDVKMGQAVFWKKNKFYMEFNEKHFYHDLVKPYVENTLDADEQNDFLTWFRSSSLLLLAELVEVTSRSKVIVGCTHISYKQLEAPAMQMLQVALSLQRVDVFSQTRRTKAIILSGDFNTPPHYPAYHFITEGRITEEMQQSIKEKTPLNNMSPEKKKFALDVLKLMPTAFAHSVKLQSAYKTVMGVEPLTTSLGDFTLDYIWFTPDHLVASAALKEPKNSYLLQSRDREVCVLFPSDHLPEVAQFYFRTR